MTALTKKPPRVCDECKFDGGFHYTDDDVPRAYRCPNYLTREQLEHAAELSAKQKTAATEAARRIVADAAERFVEFSANQLHDEIEAAQIEGSGVMGNAFTWAKNEGLIEWTGRMVKSQLPGTNEHRIFVWRSLIYRPGGTA